MNDLEDRLYTKNDVEGLVAVELTDEETEAWWDRSPFFMDTEKTSREWCDGTPEEIDAFFRALWAVNMGIGEDPDELSGVSNG